MKKFYLAFIFLLGAFSASMVHAFDLWQFPEAADKNSVFLDARFGGISFLRGPEFFLPEASLDYMLWGGLPFSIGAYIKTPEENLKSFGARLGYHVNTGSRRMDLYGLYVFDFGWTRNKALKAHNDEEQPMNFYDFRVGIRYRFNFFHLNMETDFKFRGINFGIGIKLN
jgi:hypothetical protein